MPSMPIRYIARAVRIIGRPVFAAIKVGSLCCSAPVVVYRRVDVREIGVPAVERIAGHGYELRSLPVDFT